MKTKLCLAALLLLPSLAVAECLIEDENAWLEYRNATCQLIAGRDDENLSS